MQRPTPSAPTPSSASSSSRQLALDQLVSACERADVLAVWTQLREMNRLGMLWVREGREGVDKPSSNGSSALVTVAKAPFTPVRKVILDLLLLNYEGDPACRRLASSSSQTQVQEWARMAMERWKRSGMADTAEARALLKLSDSSDVQAWLSAKLRSAQSSRQPTRSLSAPASTASQPRPPPSSRARLPPGLLRPTSSASPSTSTTPSRPPLVRIQTAPAAQAIPTTIPLCPPPSSIVLDPRLRRTHSASPCLEIPPSSTPEEGEVVERKPRPSLVPAAPRPVLTLVTDLPTTDEPEDMDISDGEDEETSAEQEEQEQRSNLDGADSGNLATSPPLVRRPSPKMDIGFLCAPASAGEEGEKTPQIEVEKVKVEEADDGDGDFLAFAMPTPLAQRTAPSCVEHKPPVFEADDSPVLPFAFPFPKRASPSPPRASTSLASSSSRALKRPHPHPGSSPYPSPSPSCSPSPPPASHPAKRARAEATAKTQRLSSPPPQLPSSPVLNPFAGILGLPRPAFAPPKPAQVEPIKCPSPAPPAPAPPFQRSALKSALKRRGERRVSERRTQKHARFVEDGMLQSVLGEGAGSKRRIWWSSNRDSSSSPLSLPAAIPVRPALQTSPSTITTHQDRHPLTPPLSEDGELPSSPLLPPSDFPSAPAPTAEITPIVLEPTKLHIGCLAVGTTKAELLWLFATEKVPVLDCDLRTKFEPCKAFVTVTSPADAQKAIARLHGRHLGFRPMTVRLHCRDYPPRSNFPSLPPTSHCTTEFARPSLPRPVEGQRDDHAHSSIRSDSFDPASPQRRLFERQETRRRLTWPLESGRRSRSRSPRRQPVASSVNAIPLGARPPSPAPKQLPLTSPAPSATHERLDWPPPGRSTSYPPPALPAYSAACPPPPPAPQPLPYTYPPPYLAPPPVPYCNPSPPPPTYTYPYPYPYSYPAPIAYPPPYAYPYTYPPLPPPPTQDVQAPPPPPRATWEGQRLESLGEGMYRGGWNDGRW